MGSLSLMDDQPQRPSPNNNNNNRGGSVDLYEWDGKLYITGLKKVLTCVYQDEHLMLLLKRTLRQHQTNN